MLTATENVPPKTVSLQMDRIGIAHLPEDKIEITWHSNGKAMFTQVVPLGEGEAFEFNTLITFTLGD